MNPANLDHHEFPAEQDFNRFFLWQASGNPQKEEKKERYISPQDGKCLRLLRSDEEGIVLIGHASFSDSYRWKTYNYRSTIYLTIDVEH